MDKKQRGDHAEQLAEQHLATQGYNLVTSNFSCKFGEVDLIMRSPEQELVFVEVRYRKNNDFGGALESVTEQKQYKVQQAAEYYLQQHKLTELPCRFDVIAITEQHGKPHIDWIENAF